MEVTCPTQIEVAPGHFLRRPPSEELQKVREAIKSSNGPFDPSLRFESTVMTVGDATHFRATIDSSKWRYWVIDVQLTPETRDRLHEIQEAARLSAVELRCHTFFHGDGIVHAGWIGQGLGPAYHGPTGLLTGYGQVARIVPGGHDAFAVFFHVAAIRS
jgi:hypothetical protein